MGEQRGKKKKVAGIFNQGGGKAKKAWKEEGPEDGGGIGSRKKINHTCVCFWKKVKQVASESVFANRKEAEVDLRKCLGGKGKKF